MINLDIEKFNPTVAELNSLVGCTKDLIVSDLEDKKQLEVVKEARIRLRNTRVKIEKAGKELRTDALAFQKAVIAKEKELIGIIEPEEVRLQEIESEAAKLAEAKKRIELVPERRARLIAIGFEEESELLTEDHLVSMDTLQFEIYYNESVASINSQKQAEAERLQAEREAVARAEQEAKDAELRAREEKVLEAERKIEEEARAKVREEKAREDERTRMEKEQVDALAKKEAEEKQALAEETKKKELLEKQKKYVTYRASCGWTKETAGDFNEDTVGDEIIIWKKVGVFKLK